MPLFSPLIHRAFEFAARAHEHQKRKATDTPYISHPAMVALLLQRAGFDDEVIAAAALHDVAEDAGVTIAELRRAFGPRVAKLVEHMTEQKLGADGRERPWAVRKQEHFEQLRDADVEVQAIALADKLHNLSSTWLDSESGIDVWSRFKAAKETWLAHAKRVIDACDGEDERQHRLAMECRSVLRKLAGKKSSASRQKPRSLRRRR